MRMLTILALLLCTPALAQEAATEIPAEAPAEVPAEAPAEAPAAISRCAAPEHRQFDFWLGEWDVMSDGKPAGTNRVVSIQNGCALQENWQGAGAGGISGTSFNIYDRATKRWHQTWVDAGGTLLQLDGGLVDGVMVLKGTRPAPNGNGTAQHRISWTPNPDGSVQQLWEASQDNGSTWQVIFDGLYQRTDATDETW